MGLSPDFIWTQHTLSTSALSHVWVLNRMAHFKKYTYLLPDLAYAADIPWHHLPCGWHAVLLAALRLARKSTLYFSFWGRCTVLGQVHPSIFFIQYPAPRKAQSSEVMRQQRLYASLDMNSRHAVINASNTAVDIQKQMSCCVLTRCNIQRCVPCFRLAFHILQVQLCKSINHWIYTQEPPFRLPTIKPCVENMKMLACTYL